MDTLTYINWTLVAASAGLIVGWWLRGQTFATIENDIASIKTDIINIKNYFVPQQAAVVTPVAPAPIVIHAQEPISGVAAA